MNSCDGVWDFLSLCWSKINFHYFNPFIAWGSSTMLLCFSHKLWRFVCPTPTPMKDGAHEESHPQEWYVQSWCVFPILIGKIPSVCWQPDLKGPATSQRSTSSTLLGLAICLGLTWAKFGKLLVLLVNVNWLRQMGEDHFSLYIEKPKLFTEV